MKILVDTNVIIDALTSREPFREYAEQAKSVMSKLFELFQILDVASADCQEALSSEVNDYEDAVLSCCAFRNRMDYIVTRNIKEYEKSKTSVILPEIFINMFTQEQTK